MDVDFFPSSARPPSGLVFLIHSEMFGFFNSFGPDTQSHRTRYKLSEFICKTKFSCSSYIKTTSVNYIFEWCEMIVYFFAVFTTGMELIKHYKWILSVFAMSEFAHVHNSKNPSCSTKFVIYAYLSEFYTINARSYAISMLPPNTRSKFIVRIECSATHFRWLINGFDHIRR